jgi:hypothetical protein
MRTRILIWALAIAGLAFPAAATAQKSYVAERFDTTVAVQPDGSLRVTEVITFRFEGGPFAFVFRDLALRGLTGIDEITATMDGRAFSPGTQAGQVEIKQGDPIRATWHYAPVSDSRHTFGLCYRVVGALRGEGQEGQLVWRAVPEDHDYVIETGQVTLELPPGTRLLGPARLEGAQAASTTTSGSRVVLPFGRVEPNVPVDMLVDFDPGAIPLAGAEIGAAALRPAFGAQVVWVALAIAGLGSVVGIAGLAVWWRREWGGRTSVPPSPPRVEPPADLAPGLAAMLLGGRSPALGTLFDLARRGAIRIEQTPSRWTKRAYGLSLQSTQESLSPHEEGLLRSLFKRPAGAGELLSIQDAGTRLAGSPAAHRQPLHAQMVSRGWLDPRLESQRTRMMVAGVLGTMLGLTLVILGMVGLGALAVNAGGWVAVLSAAVAGFGGAGFVAGVVALFLGLAATALTPEGRRQNLAWQAFESHLRAVARGQDAAVQVNAFERFLPYAAGFGMASAWARHFQKQGLAEVPAWFQGLEAADFADVTAAVIASTTSVSAGADGGGGASGGGASGAG